MNPASSTDAPASDPPLPLRDMQAAYGPRFKDIVDQYLAALPGTLAAMQDACMLGMAPTLAAAAHRLAGRSAALGAGEVASLCRSLETACLANEGIPADAAQRLVQISAACDAFSVQLAAIGGQLRASSG